MSRPGTSQAMGSVLSTLRVLEEVAQRQPIGVSDLARISGMPKSTVQRCLVTLRQAGWLRVVDADRARWGVTSKPLEIGLAAAGNDSLRDIAAPHLENLRDATNETAHFSVRSGNALLVVLREDGLQPVRTYIEVGKRVPIHASSSGLAFMAKMQPDELDAVLDGALEKLTGTTLVSRDALLAEIERTCERGYAVNDVGWQRSGVSGVGAAIVSAAGRPVATVSVSVPSGRFEPAVTRYGRLVVDAAAAVSAELRDR